MVKRGDAEIGRRRRKGGGGGGRRQEKRTRLRRGGTSGGGRVETCKKKRKKTLKEKTYAQHRDPLDTCLLSTFGPRGNKRRKAGQRKVYGRGINYRRVSCVPSKFTIQHTRGARGRNGCAGCNGRG